MSDGIDLLQALTETKARIALLESDLAEARDDAKSAHAEVGRYASFVLRLFACDTPEDMCQMVTDVVIQHHGFPAVDGSKIK